MVYFRSTGRDTHIRNYADGVSVHRSVNTHTCMIMYTQTPTKKEKENNNWGDKHVHNPHLFKMSGQMFDNTE